MRRWALATIVGIVLLAAGCAPAPSSATSTQTPLVTPSPSPRVGLTRPEAIAIARVAAQAPADWEILQADVGLPADLTNFRPVPSSPNSSPGPGYVWRVNVGFDDGPLDGQGVIVFIDYYDGHVISTASWIS